MGSDAPVTVEIDLSEAEVQDEETLMFGINRSAKARGINMMKKHPTAAGSNRTILVLTGPKSALQDFLLDLGFDDDFENYLV